jgi:alpha-tubulin suppressor-like RCC1 family protein
MKWALADPTELDYLTMFPGHKLPPMGLANVTSITSSQDMYAGGFSLAVQTDGTVQAWGNNNYGQLGDGTTVNRNYPQAVKGINGAKQAIAGNSGYVLKKDGTVWVISMSGPSQVAGLSGVTALSTTGHSYYALKADGTVWAWGMNNYGELGQGNTDYSLGSKPIQIPSLSGVKALAGNHYGRYPGSVYALKTDGTVWAWGDNTSYQLGDGSGRTQTRPVKVVNLSGVSSIAATSGGAYAAKTDGTVWVWGDNFEGQLGLPAGIRTYPLPTQIKSLSSIASVAASGGTAYALKNDGTVLAWGYNGNGEIGNDGKGDLTDEYGGHFNSTPSPVPGLTGVKSLAGSMSGGYAVKNDGSTWGWGYNRVGSIGDGTTTNRFTPVMVLRGP